VDFNIDKYRSKTAQKRHRRRLQILLIPDDQTEPKAFSLSMRQLKVIKVLGVFLILHMVIGFYGYAMISKYLIRVHALEYTNHQLSENNKRIHELADAFKALEDTDDKIRAALGLNKAPLARGLSIESMGNASAYIPDRLRFEEKSQALTMAPATAQVKVGEKLGMLQQSAQSGLHDYLRDIPTYLPVEGVLTNDYGSDEKKHGGSGHQGIDIAAPRGSFVRAAGDGVVVFSGWTEDLGNLIILYHGNGFFTYYGHNQRLLALRNIFVRKSDVIAMVGNSGASSAPHLHFEIWKDGVPLDPKQYILAFSRM
jgi:murein DD-endopeptidase MepM/ murein hydrolase activator NlpD